MRLPDARPPRAMALGCFRAWVALTQRPFDPVRRAGGARRHPLQGRRAVKRLFGRLILCAPGLHLLPLSGPVAPRAGAGIPRRIWAYWHEGEDRANPLVRACLASWRDRNPDWELRCLDAASPEMAAVRARLPDTLGIAHRTDVLRLALLAEHGGVWVDASAWCLAPLGDWLPRQDGFFAFHYPEDAVDRPLANWFLAAPPGDPIVSAWLELCLSYWAVRARPDHYFVHHFLLNWLLLTDPELGAAWRAKTLIPADPLHLAQRALREARAPGAVQAELRAAPGRYPVQKLDWRMTDRLPEIAALLAPPDAAGPGRG